MISMHRSGLWRDRYGAITTSKVRGAAGPMEQEILELAQRLEDSQTVERESIRVQDPTLDGELWHNYRVLQVFDIMSLYFSWNGYEDERLASKRIAPAPVQYGSEEEVELVLTPSGPSAVQISPYPFDVSPLPVSLRARTIEPLQTDDEAAIREAFHRAPRTPLDFEIHD